MLNSFAYLMIDVKYGDNACDNNNNGVEYADCDNDDNDCDDDDVHDNGYISDYDVDCFVEDDEVNYEFDFEDRDVDNNGDNTVFDIHCVEDDNVDVDNNAYNNDYNIDVDDDDYYFHRSLSYS